MLDNYLGSRSNEFAVIQVVIVWSNSFSNNYEFYWKLRVLERAMRLFFLRDNFLQHTGTPR